MFGFCCLCTNCAPHTRRRPAVALAAKFSLTPLLYHPSPSIRDVYTEGSRGREGESQEETSERTNSSCWSESVSTSDRDSEKVNDAPACSSAARQLTHHDSRDRSVSLLPPPPLPRLKLLPPAGTTAAARILRATAVRKIRRFPKCDL